MESTLPTDKPTHCVYDARVRHRYINRYSDEPPTPVVEIVTSIPPVPGNYALGLEFVIATVNPQFVEIAEAIAKALRESQ